jgi:hypothetical protein
MVGRSEEENAIRDAVLLTVADGDSGPIATSFVKERTVLFGRR